MPSSLLSNQRSLDFEGLPRSLVHAAPRAVATGDKRSQNAANGSIYAGWGVKCCQGFSKKMEDSYFVREQLKAALRGVPAKCSSAGPFDDLAMFSVFDGHGGEEVAKHCAERLHQHFVDRLTSMRLSWASSLTSEDSLPESAKSLSTGYFTIPSPPESPVTPVTNPLLAGAAPSPSFVSEALRSAFLATDREIAGTEAGEFTGATGVVVVLTRQHIWVAHCGDSRAALQRNGSAVALTTDHKPSREDEAARIRSAGGRIVFNGGAARVMGMLAMTRCIGDHYLRPYIIADPEVMCMERSAADEVLVVATDGLWDMFNCLEATRLASRCIMQCKGRGMSAHGACRVASNVLVKAAMDRGSRDNITVVVVLLCARDVTMCTAAEAEGEGGAGFKGAGSAQTCAAELLAGGRVEARKPGDAGPAEVGGGEVEWSGCKLKQQPSPCSVCCICSAGSSPACSDVGEEWDEAEDGVRDLGGGDSSSVSGLSDWETASRVDAAEGQVEEVLEAGSGVEPLAACALAGGEEEGAGDGEPPELQPSEEAGGSQGARPGAISP